MSCSLSPCLGNCSSNLLGNLFLRSLGTLPENLILGTFSGNLFWQPVPFTVAEGLQLTLLGENKKNKQQEAGNNDYNEKLKLMDIYIYKDNIRFYRPPPRLRPHDRATLPSWAAVTSLRANSVSAHAWHARVMAGPGPTWPRKML